MPTNNSSIVHDAHAARCSADDRLTVVAALSTGDFRAPDGQFSVASPALMVGSYGPGAEWTRTDLSGFNDLTCRPLDAARDGAGSAVVVGGLCSTLTFGVGWPGDPVGGKTISPTTQQVQYLAKYHSDGHLMWAKAMGAGQMGPASVSGAPDGSVYAAGRFVTDFYFSGTKRLTFPGDGFFLNKATTSGAFGWARRIRTNSVDNVSTTALPGGGAVVAFNAQGSGWVDNGSGGTVAFNNTLPQFFLAKYGANGTLNWTATTVPVNQAGNTWVRAITAADNGSVYVLGDAYESVTFGSGQANATTVGWPFEEFSFVAHYQANGSFDWVQVLYHNPWMQAGNVSTRALDAGASDDGVVVAVEFEGSRTFLPGTPLEQTPVPDDQDVMVFQFTQSGTPLFIRQISGPYDQTAVDVSVDSFNDLVTVNGWFYQQVKVGMGDPNGPFTFDVGDLPAMYFEDMQTH